MAKEIILTNGKTASVDDEDYERVNAHSWCYDGGYAVRRNGLKKQRLHTFILDVPVDVEIDHKDNNGLMCTRSNMRICTHTENLRNRRKFSNNTSGYKGVHWHKGTGKWRSQIKVNHKYKSLGLFTSIEDAAKAYDIAAKKYFGEFAKTNF